LLRGGQGRRGTIGFWDFKLTGAPPLLSCVVRPHTNNLAAMRIEDYAPQYEHPLVELWRNSFEYGVGIKDPHPLEDQIAYYYSARFHSDSSQRSSAATSIP
jgi:hypothetical protein